MKGFRIVDGQDQTKQIKFDLSNISSGTERVLTVPDEEGMILIISSNTPEGIIKVQGGIASILETNIIGEEIEELTNGSVTALHSHLGGGGGSVYVDRGDNITDDFTTSDFIRDGAYHELDLSGFIPFGTKLISITGYLRNSAANKAFRFGETSHISNKNIHVDFTQNANQLMGFHYDIIPDENRRIRYQFDNANFLVVILNIRGWWV